MKAIGILLDNYKLPTFSNELQEVGLIGIIIPVNDKESVIKIHVMDEVYDDSVEMVSNICDKLR